MNKTIVFISETRRVGSRLCADNPRPAISVICAGQTTDTLVTGYGEPRHHDELALSGVIPKDRHCKA